MPFSRVFGPAPGAGGRERAAGAAIVTAAFLQRRGAPPAPIGSLATAS